MLSFEMVHVVILYVCMLSCVSVHVIMRECAVQLLSMSVAFLHVCVYSATELRQCLFLFITGFCIRVRVVVYVHVLLLVVLHCIEYTLLLHMGIALKNVDGCLPEQGQLSQSCYPV